MSKDVNLEDIGGSPEEHPKIGEYLRQTREARGLSIDAVARSLKLNPKHIEALESEHFEEFPAPPYVRVYLRAVAKHLSLDPSHVLQLYRRQEGLVDTGEEGSETKVDMSIVSPGKSSPPWGLILVLLGALVAIGVVANQMDLFSFANAVQEPSAPADTTAEPADSLIAPPDSLEAAEAEQDSLLEPSPDTDAEAEAAAEEPDSLILSMSAMKDSVWAQVVRDGRSWDGFIKAGKPRVFRAKDTLNVLVGQNSNLRYTLNGNPLVPAENKGVAVFRIDHEDVTRWSQSRWKRVFGDS